MVILGIRVRIFLTALTAAFVALLTLEPVPAAQAAAGTSPWASNDQSRMRLIAATTAADKTGGLLVGLHVELNPGWKIYWRSPGDSGLPPHFDWSGSANVKDVHVLWPAPTRFNVFGYDTFAYTDEVVYPARVRVADPSRPAEIALTLQYGLCHDICIPYTQEFTLHIPAGSAESTVYKPLIDRYVAEVPARVSGTQAAHGLAVTAVAVSGPPGEESLVVAMRSDRPVKHADVIVEAPDSRAMPFFFGRPQLSPASDGDAMTVRIPVTHRKKVSVVGEPLVVTVIADGRAIEWTGKGQRAD
jgi:suppressor for copper-sensitivity B